MITIHQVYDPLVEIDSEFKAVPMLATAWESTSDGKTWTFELRKGVTFQDGSAFDAEDVLHTFDRLRDPKIGGSTVDIYSNVKSVEAPDPYTVVFSLEEPNPEFPLDVGDYHSVIVSADVENPGTEFVGTGPFSVTSYLPEDRVVLKRNPSYWMKDAAGLQLPYLDGLEVLFTADTQAQVEAVRGGTADLMFAVPPEKAVLFADNPDLKLQQGQSNYHYLLHVRSDGDRPGSDPRVRQALNLGTDHEQILHVAAEGYGSVGNSTPVGPLYAADYLDQAPAYDPAAAKALLAEAGYADGLTIDLPAMRYGPIPTIATVWKEQMQKIGVTVNIEVVPADIYYGEGEQSWLNVDWGITDWTTKARPVTYFTQSLITGAAWNESHWSDKEFDQLTAEINREMDSAKRSEMYKQAQSILIERGPVIVFYIEKPLMGMSSALQGFEPAVPEVATSYRSVYLSR